MITANFLQLCMIVSEYSDFFILLCIFFLSSVRFLCLALYDPDCFFYSGLF